MFILHLIISKHCYKSLIDKNMHFKKTTLKTFEIFEKKYFVKGSKVPF